MNIIKKETVKGFEPIWDENSEILIVGTVPGKKSRRTGSYYSNRGNRFWTNLEKLFGDPVPEDDEERKKYLRDHHVALADVCKICKIKGSLDKDISAPSYNDKIKEILGKAKIKMILCNGGKAEKLLRKYLLSLPESFVKDFDVEYVPSTSGANRRYCKTDDDLAIAWKKRIMKRDDYDDIKII